MTGARLAQDMAAVIGVVVGEGLNASARKPGAGMGRGMAQLVEDDQVVGAHEARDHAAIGEVARAEDARPLLALEAGEPGFQIAVERVVARHQAGCAGAGAEHLDRFDGGAFDVGVLRQTEIIVAAERHQRAAVALGSDARAAPCLTERALETPLVELVELGVGELIQRRHTNAPAFETDRSRA